MAAKDNQTYQLVAVSAFIVAVLALGGAIFLYTSYSKEFDAKTEANAARQTAETALSAAQGELNHIKTLLGLPSGASGTDDVDAKLLDYATRAHLSGDGVENVTFEMVFESLSNERDEARLAQQNQAGVITKLESEKAAQATQFAAKEKELLGKVAQAEASRDALASDWETERTRITEEKDRLVAQLEELRTKSGSEIADLTTKLTSTQQAYDQLQTQLNQLKDEIDLERPANLDLVDGNVLQVYPREKTLWINVGRADGLQPRTTFSVYDEGSFNAPGAMEKGKIEVVRIIDDQLAECRITLEDIARPIQRGDEIYSPVWAPGRKDGFAITGFVDLDGDGKSDVDKLISLIKQNGGQVDAYVDAKGATPPGAGPDMMSARTSYLIIGQDPSEVPDLKDSDAYIRSNTAMREAARKLSIRVIPLERFLNQLGYRPSRRQIRLDEVAPLGEGPNPAAPSVSGARRTRYTRY